MNSLDLERVVSLGGPRPEGARRRKRIGLPSAFTWTRRGFIKATVVAGAAAGVSALGVFPPARQALADGYDIKPLPCPSGHTDDNCNPGCGPSMNCDDCCGSDDFFKNDNMTYRLRPNECWNGTWDGWKWRYDATCNCCRSFIIYQCHDGEKKVSGSWVPRICRSVVQCGNPCP